MTTDSETQHMTCHLRLSCTKEVKRSKSGHLKLRDAPTSRYCTSLHHQQSKLASSDCDFHGHGRWHSPVPTSQGYCRLSYKLPT
jgi:hypothetical protein